jgi:hypothetical protein
MQDRFGTTKLLHKEMMNMSNEQIRHCRIGRVHCKVQVLGGGMAKSKFWETPIQLSPPMPSRIDVSSWIAERYLLT